MVDWQPIETAPRDGRRVLLFWPSYAYEVAECGDRPAIDIGWWTVNSRLGDEYHDPGTGKLVFKSGAMSAEKKAHLEALGIVSPAYFTNTDEADCYGQAQAHNAPTHWLPLPNAPATSSKA